MIKGYLSKDNIIEGLNRIKLPKNKTGEGTIKELFGNQLQTINNDVPIVFLVSADEGLIGTSKNMEDMNKLLSTHIKIKNGKIVEVN